MEFFYTRLDFFDNNNKLSGDCYYFDKSIIFTTNNLYFDFSVAYSQNLCAFNLNYLVLSSLTFNGFKNSFLQTNYIGFFQLNNESINLNINISIVNLQNIYNIDIDGKLLYKFVFKQVKTLFLSGYLKNSFENNLIKSLSYLNKIEININNLRSFFHSSTKWFDEINFDLQKVDLNSNSLMELLKHGQTKIFITVFGQYLSWTYSFPDEDFCLFKNYPHERLALPIIFTKALINCTCTQCWLLRYNSIYNKIINKTTMDIEFTQSPFILNCSNLCSITCHEHNFCDISSINSKGDDNYINLYTTYIYPYYLAEFIFQVILFPLMNLLSFISCTISLIALKNKRKKRFIR